MYKKYFYFIGLFVFANLFGCARDVFAQTIVPADTVISQETWTAQGSPYILSGNIYIYSGQELNIEQGVEIFGKEGIEEIPGINISGGTLNIAGNETNRVNIHNIDGIFASSKSTVMIDFADFDIDTGISLVNSWAYIGNTVIMNAFKALNIKNSDVRICNSRIKNNKYGIYVSPISTPVLMMNDKTKLFGTGGIGNALNELPPVGSFVQIENTSLVGNSVNALVNKYLDRYIIAKNNWWGNEDGPSLVASIPNSILGNIEYDPWLKEDPDSKKKCCSSVLFIPGLEGTKLHTYESNRNGVKNTNTLWEPINNKDVIKLYLDNTGSSIDKNVFSGEPLGKAYGLFGIYGGFMKFLDRLVDNGKINEWKAFGYDWREPINEIIDFGTKKSTTTESLVDTIIGEAKNSKTGKVSIISHSNGGLVTKALIKRLNEIGMANIVDSVISVAVPYLGTPQAIPGLLYGDGQSIALGLIASQSVVRDLGINMPSAYSLLPSRDYFNKIFNPTIAFASSTIQGINNGKYPIEIANKDDQDSFVVDEYKSRNDVKFGDINTPIKGNSLLLAASNVLHGILDLYNWPSTMTNYAIVGWNKVTTSGIKYATNKRFTKKNTIMGDGTVVAPSAAYKSTQTVSADLSKISEEEKTSFSHANILESSSTQKMVENIVTNNSTDKALQNLPYGFSLGEPDYSKEPTFLVVSTHSPVELHAYDEQGRHTGPVEVPKSLGVEDGLLYMYEDKIPGSNYDGGGELDDSYIYLPEDKKQKYTIKIIGKGVGEFTYNVERVRNGETFNSVEYSNIPVTQLTIASTTVTSLGKSLNVPIDKDSFASSTQSLSIDIDGSGTGDMIVKPNEKVDIVELLEQYKVVLSKIDKDSSKGRSLIKQIENLQKKILDNKYKKYDKHIENISKKIKHKIYKTLNNKDKDELRDMIEETIKTITIKNSSSTMLGFLNLYNC